MLASGNAMASITVDGNLTDDWGVTPAGWGTTNWNPTNGAIHSDLTNEDGKGGLGGYLGPGYGGQLFDAEAMYYKRENDTIFLAIVTGLPYYGGQDARGNWYYPGDIAIDFNGDGVYEYGIETRGANAGTLWGGLSAADWNGGLPNWHGEGDPTDMKDGVGTQIGSQFQFVYNNSYYWVNNSTNYNKHYVMEMAIPQSYFGSDWMNGGYIHWNETCGNDALDLYVPKTAPEPASVVLLGLGLAGLIGAKKKKVIYRP